MKHIHIIIKSCSDCQYLDHSGAFTEGGAKSICNNYYALSKEYQRHWKYRIVDTNKLPSWCPLENC